MKHLLYLLPLLLVGCVDPGEPSFEMKEAVQGTWVKLKYDGSLDSTLMWEFDMWHSMTTQVIPTATLEWECEYEVYQEYIKFPKCAQRVTSRGMSPGGADPVDGRMSKFEVRGDSLRLSATPEYDGDFWFKRVKE